jgi:Zn-dependent peptidase ImmA (M78 family)
LSHRNIDDHRPSLALIEANLFAQQLLMPEHVVGAMIWHGYRDIEKLAGLFQVSGEWMESRLRSLNYRVH